MSNVNSARPVPAAPAADAPALQPELAAAASADAVPAIRTEDAVPGLLDPDGLPPDAHGHDPALYDWYPVLRRPRADGWTPAKQRLFIETLADTASPKQAARAVGMTPTGAYKLRRSPGGEGFAAAWDAAVHQGAKRLVDIALERAVDGVEEPVFDRDGRVIHLKTRYNDRLLMFLIRAHLPERYWHAHEDRRAAHEPAPTPEPPVAEAVARVNDRTALINCDRRQTDKQFFSKRGVKQEASMDWLNDSISNPFSSFAEPGHDPVLLDPSGRGDAATMYGLADIAASDLWLSDTHDQHQGDATHRSATRTLGSASDGTKSENSESGDDDGDEDHGDDRGGGGGSGAGGGGGGSGSGDGGGSGGGGEVVVTGTRGWGGFSGGAGLAEFHSGSFGIADVAEAILALEDVDSDGDAKPDMYDDHPFQFDEVVVTGYRLNPDAVQYADEEMAVNIGLYLAAQFYGGKFLGGLLTALNIDDRIVFLAGAGISAATSDTIEFVHDQLWDAYYNQAMTMLSNGVNLADPRDKLERDYGIDDGQD